MTLLDRYILKELFGPFFFGIVAFTLILTGSTVLFHMIGEAIKYGIPLIPFFQLMIFKTPQIIALSFPMSMLLATILAFGRLNSDLEIIAFRAGGVSFLRLIVPVIVAGFVVSMFTIMFNESIVPRAANSAENLFSEYRNREDPTVKQQINLTEYKDGLPSRIINVGEIDKGLLKSITVAEYETGQLSRLIRANTGRWIKSGGWEFYDGIMHQFGQKNLYQITMTEFKKEYIDIKISPVDLDKRNKAPEEMSSRELKERIERQRKTGKDPIRDVMNYHMKFAIAFASLIFSILGSSVGLRPHRSSSALGLGLSLVIILIYYVLMAVGMGLGLGHTLPPIIATWIPNIVVGIVGLIMLNKLAQQ